MRMSKEIKLGIKKSSRGEKKNPTHGGREMLPRTRLCSPPSLAGCPPPPRTLLMAFFTSFGPDSQPSWRPSHPRAGSSASRAFPFPPPLTGGMKSSARPRWLCGVRPKEALSSLCFASAVMGADSIRARVMGSRGSALPLSGGSPVPLCPPQHGCG